MTEIRHVAHTETMMKISFTVEGLKRANCLRQTKRNIRKRQVALVAKLLRLGKTKFRGDEDCQTELRRLSVLTLKVGVRMTWRLQDEVDDAVESVMEA